MSIQQAYPHRVHTLRQRLRVVRPIADRKRGEYDPLRVVYRRKSHPPQPKLFERDWWRACTHCGGRAKGKHWTICDSCDRKRHHANTIRLLRKAEWIDASEWGDLVFWDGGSYNNGYYDSVTQLLDECEWDGIQPPAFVATCTPSGVSIDIDDILETLAVDHLWDDADSDCFNGNAALREAVEAWNKRQAKIVLNADWSRVVVLDRSAAEQWLSNDVNNLPNTRYCPASSYWPLSTESLETDLVGLASQPRPNN